ncbi:MAG TPA: TrkA family potassium uptake protein [Ktedonobacteraceae bacterium]|nr:TrkA family potassium uptake protein [Ktedonobacteraceae bacterium]
MKIVILGCGRVGATLANIMDQAGHNVSVIDYSSDAFQRLHPDFSGETIVGNGVDEEVLMRAGIQNADAFAAVTNGDNRNIMASQIAKDIFHVKKVVCRIYDPIRESTYHELGLETICPTIVGAKLISEALLGGVPAVPAVSAATPIKTSEKEG